MSATTFLRRRNYAGDTCKNEEFPAATFGKAFCIFWYLGVAKNRYLYNKKKKSGNHHSGRKAFNRDVLSSGTAEGIDVAIFLASMIYIEGISGRSRKGGLSGD